MIYNEIIVATQNKGKVAEFESLLSKYYKKVYSLLDFQSVPEIVEDGETFAENALIKARIIQAHFNKTVIADDSGLVVDSLAGEPGVYSARYAGEGATDDKNIDKLLDKLNGEMERTARFVCCLALVYPDGKEFIFEGVCEGTISNKRVGKNGFGYDPVFYTPALKKTMAELEPEQKNSISHRAEAVSKLIFYLKGLEIN